MNESVYSDDFSSSIMHTTAGNYFTNINTKLGRKNRVKLDKARRGLNNSYTLTNAGNASIYNQSWERITTVEVSWREKMFNSYDETANRKRKTIPNMATIQSELDIQGNNCLIPESQSEYI